MKTTMINTDRAPKALTVGSRESHMMLEEGMDAATQGGKTLVEVQHGATLVYAFNLAPLTDHCRSLHFKIAESATVEVFGLTLGTDDRSLDMSITTDHQGKDSTGKVNVRTLLTDTAHVSLHGMIAIRKTANRSDGFLEGRMILLSPDARAEVVPSLEIEARDVRASHAATTSPIDQEQLRYLGMRGIPPDQSRVMILRGFFDDILLRLPESEERERIRSDWNSRFESEL